MGFYIKIYKTFMKAEALPTPWHNTSEGIVCTVIVLRKQLKNNAMLSTVLGVVNPEFSLYQSYARIEKIFKMKSDKRKTRSSKFRPALSLHCTSNFISISPWKIPDFAFIRGRDRGLKINLSIAIWWWQVGNKVFTWYKD